MNSLVDELLRNISPQPVRNIEMAVKMLAEEAGADGCLIAVEDSGEFSVITSGGNRITALPGVFQRVKTENQTVVITEGLPDNLNAVMCIPVIAGQRDQKYEGEKRQVSDISRRIKGYAYFQSTKETSRFTPGFREEHQGVFSLLSNFIELHQILQVASTDKLTGALNRKFTDDALEASLKQAKLNGSSFSVIMTDLDFFKHVNDTFGHLVGDDVLRETSAVMRKNLKKGDKLGRYGGEEFIIMLSDIDSSQARVIAERIRATIQASRILGDKRDITISLGIASYPEHAGTVVDLVEKADKALYTAKKTGRNKHETWNESMNELVIAKDSRQVFFSGDSAKDATRIQALYKLMGLPRLEASAEERVSLALDIVQSIIGSTGITMFKTDDVGGIKSSCCKLIPPGREQPTYNDEVIRDVIDTQKSLCFVDWDNNKISKSTDIADWQSVIVVPAVFTGRLLGVIYAGVSVKTKEFTSDELAFVQNAAIIIAGMLE